MLSGGHSVETLEAISLTDTTPMNLTGNEIGQYLSSAMTATTSYFRRRRQRLADRRRRKRYDHRQLLGEHAGGRARRRYLFRDRLLRLHLRRAGGGDDRVAAGTSYTLGLSLSGDARSDQRQRTTALNLTGNGFNRRSSAMMASTCSTARAALDVLIGAGGADTSPSPRRWAAADRHDRGLPRGRRHDRALDDAVFTGLNAGRAGAGAPSSSDPGRRCRRPYRLQGSDHRDFIFRCRRQRRRRGGTVCSPR